MKDNQDHLNVLRSIQKRPESSQRELAKNLGFSLGKLNYCLKALQDKGLVKIQNFQKRKDKIKYTAGLETNFDNLGINIKSAMPRILSGINNQRLLNNPIKIDTETIKKVLLAQ